MNTKEFIEKAKRIHGDKYDYSKVKYVNNRTKVCIICPEHGEFWQRPTSHLKGCICYRCSQKEKAKKQKKSSTNEFIEKAKKIHGDKYDYSKVEYINAKTKVCIICPEHGEFWQVPNYHLSGNGCKLCGIKTTSDSKKSNTINFIQKAKEVHGDKYDYSKVEYTNNHSIVNIICPKHGEFWQRPSNHLRGQGCPICNESHLENKIRLFLEEYSINYEKQKKFIWLNKQTLDFYIPFLKMGIECQGVQHFKPIDFAGEGKEWAYENFKYIKNNDKVKKELCEQNGIKILYFNYNDKINKFKEKILWLVREFTEQ